MNFHLREIAYTCIAILIRIFYLKEALFYSYVTFLISLMMSSSYVFSQEIFILIVIPIFSISIIAAFYNDSRERFNFNYKNCLSIILYIRRYGQSSIFISCLIYIIGIAISSMVSPQPELGWFWPLCRYAFSICMFLIITAELNIEIDNFKVKLFTIITWAGSATTAFNLYLYFMSLPELLSFPYHPYFPTFGYIPDHWSTTSATFYALLFVATINLIFYSRAYIALHLVNCIVFFMALLLTQSRSGILAIIIGSSLPILSSNFFKKRLFYSCGILSFVISIMTFIIMQLSKKKLDNHRIELWEAFVQLIAERPLIGYGERINVEIEVSDGQKLGHAHNLLLSSFFRGGLSSFLAAIVITTLCLNYSYQYFKSTKDAIPISLFITVLTSGLVDFELLVFLPDWQWFSFWLPIGLCMGSECYVKANKKI